MLATSLKRILIVEDDPDIQAIIRFSLESVGHFTVKVCSNGREALSLASSFAPDLILLDVMMPHWDGTILLKVLRKQPQTSHIPVIFLTDRVQPHQIVQYKELGALDVIAKPFDPMTLPQKINNIWSKAAFELILSNSLT